MKGSRRWWTEGDRQQRWSGSKLHLSPPFHLDENAAGLSRRDCILYANVARATHGETQPEKIVGNGDAHVNQTFALPTERISWVSDANFAPGVRADPDAAEWDSHLATG